MLSIKEYMFLLNIQKYLKESYSENMLNHGNSDELSQKLHDSTHKGISDKDARHISDYTDDSSYLNKSLIRHNGKLPHDFDKEEAKTHKSIMKNAKPSGYSFHVYSYTKFPFHKHIDKEKLFKSPAHISTSHDENFINKYRNKNTHIIHIHVKPTDKVLHVSKNKYNTFKDQHETIIPSGTTLKYSHSDGNIHHFTIHSQE